MDNYAEISGKERVIEGIKALGIMTIQAFASGLAMAAGGYAFGRLAGGAPRLPTVLENVTPIRKVGT